MAPKGLGLDSVWRWDKNIQILGLKIPDDDVLHAGDPGPCGLAGRGRVLELLFFFFPLRGYWGFPRFSHNLKSQGPRELT